MRKRIKLTLEPHEMNEYQKTDILLEKGNPFITLTESKISNLWYHEHLPLLFILTAEGFVVAQGYGNKEVLLRNGFGR